MSDYRTGQGAGTLAGAAGSFANALGNIIDRRRQHTANVDQQELISAQRQFNTSYNEWLASSQSLRWDEVEGSYENWNQAYRNEHSLDQNMFTNQDTQDVFNDWMEEQISAKRVPVAESASSMRTQYRQGLFQDNIEGAVADRDLGQVVEATQAAVEQGIINDYDKDDVIAGAARDIKLSGTRELIFAFADENGYEEAIAQLDTMGDDPDPKTGLRPFEYIAGIDESGNPIVQSLSRDDVTEIKEQVRDELQIQRSEEDHRINQRDLRAQNEAKGIEAQAINGEISWGEAVQYVIENREEFKPSNYRMLITRFRNEMEEDAVEGPFAADTEMRITYENIYDAIRNEEDWNVIEDMISEAARPDENGLIYLSDGMKSTLRGLNSNRSRTSDPTEQMINDVLGEFPDLSNGFKAVIRNRVREQLPALARNPDGSFNQGAITDQMVREIVTHMAAPIRIKNTSAVVMESMNRTWFGNMLEGAGIQPGRIESVEEMRQQAWAGVHTGTIDITKQMQVLAAGITDEETLRQYFEGGRTVMTDAERISVDNNVKFAQMYAGDRALYQQYFGRMPRVSSSMNPDDSEVWIDAQTGALYFKTPDGEHVTLRVNEEARDERWYVWNGAGWQYSERHNTPQVAPAAPVAPDGGIGEEVLGRVERAAAVARSGGEDMVAAYEAALAAADLPDDGNALADTLMTELEALPTPANMPDQIALSQALSRLRMAQGTGNTSEDRVISQEEITNMLELLARLKGE